jgi:high-affinity iron transporter
MLAAALLVFREVLEAALVIGIVCAATRGMQGRGRWVTSGVVAGVLAAALVALGAEGIAEAAGGVGQELFNAGVLLAAVLMLAWHAIWMSKHGRELSTQMKIVGQAVQSGTRPPTALLVVVGLAVLREGSEIVLFLYGLVAGGSGSGELVLGSGLGLVLGVVVGLGLYLGLLRIPMRYFFTATNWLLLLLAAGMASQAARYLIQADWLPTLGTRLWDTSHILSEGSLVGQAMRALVGYDPRPAGMQILFYLVTGFLIALGMKLWGSPARPQEARS